MICSLIGIVALHGSPITKLVTTPRRDVLAFARGRLFLSILSKRGSDLSRIGKDGYWDYEEASTDVLFPVGRDDELFFLAARAGDSNCLLTKYQKLAGQPIRRWELRLKDTSHPLRAPRHVGSLRAFAEELHVPGVGRDGARRRILEPIPQEATQELDRRRPYVSYCFHDLGEVLTCNYVTDTGMFVEIPVEGWPIHNVGDDEEFVKFRGFPTTKKELSVLARPSR